MKFKLELCVKLFVVEQQGLRHGLVNVRFPDTLLNMLGEGREEEE